MTITEPITNAFGQRATGIPAITCPSWCTDPGHVASVARYDQTCWGSDHYVEPSMEDVHPENLDAGRDQWEVDLPRIGPCAYRGFNQHPLVYLHIYLPGMRSVEGLDASCKLTAPEARQLAAHLITVADEIEPGSSTANLLELHKIAVSVSSPQESADVP